MNKREFLALLRKGLAGLPPKEAEERLIFYSEMIDDRMEEGLSEAEAVAAVGSVESIVAQVIADTPVTAIANQRIKPKRRMKVWEILLLALGSPVWLSLGLAAFAAVLSLYVSLWAVIISLWAAFVSVAVCALAGVVACVVFILGGSVPVGIAVLVAGLVCAGLSILLFLGCKAATRGTLVLTKKLALWTRNCFIRKEEA